ncbi:dihydrofolate reductase family protein [Endozoicomonas numazuensis]|uniref:Diacylglycerol kinase n=1 Tax=Endozoicomonas numazuensis TaxID=1137799 RepID=A0A081NE64_9GAMM|nr:dihydrofolate reductase family protein [Endozoicomonas numazuensis]KEQ16737.1 diacylglycerol kinase [Endozoicomonas numazuensis]
MSNFVYIGTSLDGYIADSNGGLDWLQMVPNPHNEDLGMDEFMAGIDALVMGRNTFEAVCGFDVDWPYSKPVFVLSSTLKGIPVEYQDKAELVSGSLEEVVETLHRKGFNNLYIDGGKTVQSFLQADMIDEMIITRVPILLGDGIPLFGSLPEHMTFEHVSTKVLLDAMVQSHYQRKNLTTG